MKIKLLTETAQVPKRATEFSAGYDLCADENYIIFPGDGKPLVQVLP